MIFFFSSSKGSGSYCSKTSGGSDSCSVTVRGSYFYVRVFAHSRLSNAKLEITGGNIESVEDVDVVTLPSIRKFKKIYTIGYLNFGANIYLAS